MPKMLVKLYGHMENREHLDKKSTYTAIVDINLQWRAFRWYSCIMLEHKMIPSWAGLKRDGNPELVHKAIILTGAPKWYWRLIGKSNRKEIPF